ncbi:uncharacterized protein DUF3300 [Collimonas sp. PA-H2]|uniref:DUF3300 domain-containing protein n=1 Tax=Collimonas sp. PA-H2 TaxID=1881062 RepID=UPI000C01D58E|nr:DUF3300 domain-containing protein [Collimonas sp. PA-H2]PFH09675.1 uncharacterized protein DUF3300 [Collimonas sp. PA-H2]
MTNNKKPVSLMLGASVCVALLSLAGCDKKTDASAPAAAPVAPQAQAAPAYVPPTAAQLYQLVGPIALFPDKLVAQVLAASSYPEQVTAADNWLGQNKNLKGTQLQDAANQQPWDVSVKGLTQFPSVLDQMAHNIPWTSALGDAYVNDPTDVMNAIQVMRQRAAASGNLNNSKQQRIARAPRVQVAPPGGYAPPPDEPPIYEGPEVIPPPPETIVIEPAEPDVVYVPAYNPGVVYGEPLPVYPGYYYEPPPAYYPPGEIVTAGVLTFGVGIAVGALIEHQHWGWNSWGVHWGGDGGGGNWRGDGDRDRGGWHRPAVVYNNNTYVSRSTTIINRVTNNYNNSTVINNNTRNNFGPGQANNQGFPNGSPAGQPGGVANFSAARPNVMQPNVARPDAARPNFAPQGNPQQARPAPNTAPFAAAPRPNHGQPDFSHMTQPNFGKIPPGAGPSAAASANQLAKPGFVHPAPNQVQPGAVPQHPGFGQPPVQNGRPVPNQLQQNALNHPPVMPKNPQGEKPPVNLNQHPFGGNPQRPNFNRPAEMAKPQPQPVPVPQNAQNRPPQQFENRPNGGQIHQEMNRPAPAPAPAFNRPEPRPQPQPMARPQPPQLQQPQQPQQMARPEPRPQPQPQPMARPEPRPQPQPQPQMQAPHPAPPPQNHEAHHDGGNLHPDKRADDHK